MAIQADVGSVVDKYSRALRAPRLLFDLYPSPRPPGKPPLRYQPIPAGVVMAVVGSFEGFAEDLLALALYRHGHSWAHIAQNADLTNPSIGDLARRLTDTVGAITTPPSNWSVKLPKQHGINGWNPAKTEGWAELLRRSEGWVQVRHCLAHGLVAGLGSELWPGPVSKKNLANQASLTTASDVLARSSIKDPAERGLYMWPAVDCARVFTHGAAHLAECTADLLGDTVDASVLLSFDSI